MYIMEQKNIKTLLLAGVITLAASMFAGCTEYSDDLAEFTSENIVINYTDSVIDASISSGSRTRSVPESTEVSSSVLTSKSGKKMYLSYTEAPWPVEKNAVTRGCKVTSAGISSTGICASVYSSSSSYTSAGCGSYFYKESVASGTPTRFYWPTSDYRISFFGYYPYNNAAFTVQSAASTTGAPTYSYTVPSAIASQQDIMTGQVVNQLGGSASPVNMTLSHRCAAIRFSITNDRSETITVNSISIEGVKYTGTINENTWTLGDAVNSSSCNPFTLTCNTSVAADATADITGTTNIFMMLPQTLPSGAKLKVVVDDEEYEAELSGSWSQGCSNTYTISISEDDTMPIGTVLRYDYTGAEQSVELPAGQYLLQCWGAQGGTSAANSNFGITEKAGGRGGYSEGVLTLTQQTTLYVYVGQKPPTSGSIEGYNGGGYCYGHVGPNSSDSYVNIYSYFGGGGGATDIRLVGGNWNESAGLLSRIIVAGGGSGGACLTRIKRGESTRQLYSQFGYVGGGVTGGGYSDDYKGTQNSGFRFGKGGYFSTKSNVYYSATGGGGWYGGGCYSASNDNYPERIAWSGGGSGFVNTAENASYRPSGYTGLELDSGTTYAGNTSFPNTSGNGNETGHQGNGYAKITRIN
jgi:hypothetical protein